MSFLNIFRKIFVFYLDGFRNMSDWGRKVWIIILIKLFIIFIILRLFFFPDVLKKSFPDDSNRSNYIREHLLSK
ncbi:MAG TPA: DUF4492 domain-containing protein [Bacteroidales bacterium]|nr:DUF4492 domain-containing protein [Bacteroidales bacterium]HOK73664.1 DUF4492 domain-containing protein [Bacteroidales bacterium]HOM39340.1 DUF4492 domain-containing protein [Bacteroidales bacterium]HOU30029.1 DUF4492 domain-containing protein [Bacteroidales bacterium]HPP91448.1 DUF4492 domain-containing protein [Bacteroidales bacterium]